jgi:hypothetical protein
MNFRKRVDVMLRSLIGLWGSMLVAPILALIAVSVGAVEPVIDVWYGDTQHFGRIGHAQRWINVLGSVDQPDLVATMDYALNGGPPVPLSMKEDRKRIARDGDFNIEIDRSRLRVGVNELVITGNRNSARPINRKVQVHYHDEGNRYPLPYSIDWSSVKNISDVAQIVDGKWRLTPDGVRAIEPYYDRVLALGDEGWQDYEVTTTVTVHAVTAPGSGPNDTGVTHAALALRWPGHDRDGKQPSVKWHPLGATAEFRLGGDLQQCRWRIFDGNREYYVESKQRRRIEFERPYRMKHRVETLSDGTSRYRVKFWPATDEEPSGWDLERIEPDDLKGGSALLIAHHADVTFGSVTVLSLKDGS